MLHDFRARTWVEKQAPAEIPKPVPRKARLEAHRLSGHSSLVLRAIQKKRKKKKKQKKKNLGGQVGELAVLDELAEVEQPRLDRVRNLVDQHQHRVRDRLKITTRMRQFHWYV